MRNTDQVMTILSGARDRIRGRRPIVESQKGHMMSLLEFAQHEIRADLPAGIDRMQQVGLEPEQTHRGPGICDLDLKFEIEFRRRTAHPGRWPDVRGIPTQRPPPHRGARGPSQTFDPPLLRHWRRGSVPATFARSRERPTPLRLRWEAPCPRAVDRPARCPPQVEDRWDGGRRTGRCPARACSLARDET